MIVTFDDAKVDSPAKSTTTVSPRRATRASVAGRRRVTVLAARLGAALREARLAAHLSQLEVAARSGVSQPAISFLELGRGASTSLDRWASVFASLGLQLAVFAEGVSTADKPRDYEHLKRQRLIVIAAASGGWRPIVEAQVDRTLRPSRSIDVLLTRGTKLEAIVVEVWDWLDDLGAALRGIDRKVASLSTQLAARPGGADEWHVGGLWVVRGTRRNRELAAEFRHLFASRFPASAAEWSRALTDPAVPMPRVAGMLWTDVKGERLLAGSRPRNCVAPSAARLPRSIRGG